MNIPFLDLGAAYSELKTEIETAVLASLRSGWYIGGQEVEAFEDEFAAYTKPKIAWVSATAWMHCIWPCVPWT